MAKGKWVSGLTGEMTQLEAARRVLYVRLTIVGEHLPRVLEESERDPEHVHQLRVGTRRADAGLRIFASCLPSSTYKYARKKLRKLRRAAGEARDWDVFRLEVLGRLPGRCNTEHPGLDFLAGYALAQRHVVQPALEKACRRALPFTEVIDRTLEELQSPANSKATATLGGLARRLLGEIHDKLAPLASGNLDDVEHLHQIRILSKRLRYAMEIFTGCFPARFRNVLYAQVEEVQEVLGRANDSVVAQARLETLAVRFQQTCPDTWPRLRPGIEELLAFHQKRIPEERERFRHWWASWSREGGVELRKMMLSRSRR
jgi:CHAD domain-containing protein